MRLSYSLVLPCMHVCCCWLEDCAGCAVTLSCCMRACMRAYTRNLLLLLVLCMPPSTHPVLPRLRTSLIACRPGNGLLLMLPASHRSLGLLLSCGAV